MVDLVVDYGCLLVINRIDGLVDLLKLKKTLFVVCC